MRKYLPRVFLALIVFSLGVLFWQGKLQKESLENGGGALPLSPQVSPTLSPEANLPTLLFKKKEYFYGFFKVGDIDRLRLIENKPRKESSRLVAENSCRSAVSGGFYDLADRPLGLFISDGEKKSTAIKSSLFNGFLWVDKENNFAITRDIEERGLEIALQTGPIFIEGGKKQYLEIRNDECKRRMAAGITFEGDLVFLTVFEKDYKLLGPRLADVPEILELIGGQEGINLASAINLDGGAASFFKTNEFVLPEYNPVGSLFCVN